MKTLESPSGSVVPDISITPKRLRFTRAADVLRERIDWLWEGWLPFRKMVSIDGHAGVGKSTVVLDLIARASRGRTMPGATRGCEPISVLIAGVEDGWGDTVRPRLEAADADLFRVEFVSTSSSTSLTLPGDVVELMAHASGIGARWLHIDSIMTVLNAQTDANQDADVRRALGPLHDAAQEYGLLVTFIRHPRKQGGLAIHAGGGSVAFTALSRVQITIGNHPDDRGLPEEQQRRVIAVGKMNLAKRPASRVYQIVSSPSGVGCIEWGNECRVSADDIAAPLVMHRGEGKRVTRDAENRPQRQIDRARTFLEAELPLGVEVTVDNLKARARAAGISWRTVERAKGEAFVSMRKTRFGGPAVWYIPQDCGSSEAASVASILPFPPAKLTHTECGGNCENGNR
jgi:putative DNA primase/helicase